MLMRTVAVVLAAGYGKRMKSELPKVMHPLLGRPMIDWVVRSVEPVTNELPVVVVDVADGSVGVDAVVLVAAARSASGRGSSATPKKSGPVTTVT